MTRTDCVTVLGVQTAFQCRRLSRTLAAIKPALTVNARFDIVLRVVSSEK